MQGILGSQVCTFSINMKIPIYIKVLNSNLDFNQSIKVGVLWSFFPGFHILGFSFLLLSSLNALFL